MATATRTIEVADLFCGAGGSSEGARQAIEAEGYEMNLVAVNHWNIAVQTHAANHPKAHHIVEDVSIVDPEAVVPEGYLDLLMASPECRYHSRARGGKPIHDQGRMNPWAVLNWLTRLNVERLLVENVPEFVKWGPLDENGYPIKAREKEYFQAWFLAIRSLGYEAQWRFLNSADYGDATTRTRFFLLARREGKPVEWPEPTHARRRPGRTLGPGLKPWRSAREIIDWSNPGLSILDEPRYQKKPLAPNTMRRIAKGLERFGGRLAPLYIRLLDIPDYPYPDVAPLLEPSSPIEAFILNRHGENGSSRAHSIDEPVPTSTTRGAGYLVHPEADRFLFANRNGNAPRSLEQPIPPATTASGGGISIAQADAEPFLLGQQSGGAPRHADQPIPTIVAPSGKISLIRPTIILYYGNSTAQSVDHPLSAITAKGGKHALIQPWIVEYYGNSEAADIDDPLHTVTTKARHALANPTLINANHGNGPEGDRGNNRRAHSTNDPLPTITTRPGLALALPDLLEHEQEFPASHTAPNFGELPKPEPHTHDPVRPLPAYVSRGDGNLATPDLQTVLIQHSIATGIDPRRIVIIDGQPYILDIKYRMLQNRELARATGFDDQEFHYHFAGNKTQITKQIGNAVPVNMAAALVRAALSDIEKG